MPRCNRCHETLSAGATACGRCGEPRVDATWTPPTATTPSPWLPLTRCPLFEAGQLIAERYEVIELLGSGGMGSVYRVFDRLLGLGTALKVIRPEHLDSEMARERFKAEVLIARRIHHPNVCRIHDIGEWNGILFFTMELLEGESLGQLLERRTALTWDEAEPILRDVLGALRAVHEAGVTHRDLKPANVILTRDGRAHLTDFGISRSDATSGLTSAFQVVGTPEYMAPEQAEGKPVDARADIYALGCMMFKVLVGVPPVVAPTPMAVMARQIKGELVLQGTLWDELKPCQRKLVTRCLAYAPEARFSDCQSVLAELERWSGGSGRPPSQRRGPSVARLPRTKPQRALRVGIVGVVAAVVIGAGANMLLRGWKGGASSVSTAETTVTGLSEDGSPLWTVDLGCPVWGASPFDGMPSRPKTFLVVSGGRLPVTNVPGTIPPRATFLTSSGETVAEIDLLSRFNPYRERYEDGRFAPEIISVEDLDQDGTNDAIVQVLHNMYPWILYFLSGKEYDCVGGIANSGHPRGIVVSRPSPDRPGFRPLLCAAVNNRMGQQNVLFRVDGMREFLASPDLDDPDLNLLVVYRPVGVKARGCRLVAEDDGSFSVQGWFEPPIRVGPSFEFSDEPCFSDPIASAKQFGVRWNTYLRVRRARSLVRAGEVEMGSSIYREAIEQERDEFVRFYAQIDGARALQQAGRPDLALDVLPADPGRCPGPAAVLLQKGALLVLAGRYDEARTWLLESRFEPGVQTWYSLPYLVPALVLNGAGPLGVYRSLVNDYPDLAGHPAVKAWALVPGLLSGDAGSAMAEVRRVGVPLSSTEWVGLQVLFPVQAKIWTSLAELEAGRSFSDWPLEDEVTAQNDPVLAAEYRLLVARREWLRVRDPNSLAGLEQAYRELKLMARIDPSALMAFTLAAYLYGTGAAEIGPPGAARDALNDGLRLYPGGRLAATARDLLAEKPDTGSR